MEGRIYYRQYVLVVAGDYLKTAAYILSFRAIVIPDHQDS